jgi:hypothetical protein
MAKSDDGICPIHGEKQWAECPHCDPEYPGMSYHDCGDDCCCCADPEPNVTCDICKGKGGWLVCVGCHPKSSEFVYGF